MKKVWLVLFFMTVLTSLFARSAKRTYEFEGVEKEYTLEWRDDYQSSVWNIDVWYHQFAIDSTYFVIPIIEEITDDERMWKDYLRWVAPEDNFKTHIYTTLIYLAREYGRATIEVPEGKRVKVYRCDHVEYNKNRRSFKIYEFISPSTTIY